MNFDILAIFEENLGVVVFSVVMSPIFALIYRAERKSYAWGFYGLGIFLRLFTLFDRGVGASLPSIIAFVILALVGFILTHKILELQCREYNEYLRAEQEAQRRKMIKEKSDLEAFKKKQELFVTASHYLRRGVNDKTFQTVAEEAGMTPQEFKAYCQKIVDNYDDLHREYNATHMIPVDYPEV